MSTAFPSLPQHKPFSEPRRGDIAHLIFAANKVALLLAGDGVCICGDLTGPVYDPSSHSRPQVCPIAVLYQAISDMEVTS